jgi:acetylglutamate/LysW-gamma-L-alpha-aminoadipate kinase
MLVVKIGGAAGISYDGIARDIAELVAAGEQMIVVHGASALANELGERLEHPPEFVTSVGGYTSRRTDRRTLEIFEMAYCGSMNKGLVERLQNLRVNAVGLSGLDGRVWEGPRKATLKVLRNGRRVVLHDDYTGKVEKVNKPLLSMLLAGGYLPVLTPPAASYDGEAINVDGDRAAAITAAVFQAGALVLLSNVPGLLQKFPDESSLVPRISANTIQAFLESTEGRMKKKLLGAKEALERGVGKVIFADGRVEQPIRRALAGCGTVIAG